MSKYPLKIDDGSTLPLAINQTTPITADSVNSLRTAIINIQTELGVNPSASYSDLRIRLDEIESSIFGIGGSGAIRSPATAIDGQALIYDGLGNWIPGNDFYDQNITTTGTVNTSEFTSGELRTGLVTLSGKVIFHGKSPEPAASDANQGIIYFNGTQFMSSENNDIYKPLGYGLTPPAAPAFNAINDLAPFDPTTNGHLNQKVVGIRNIPTEYFESTRPNTGQALIYTSSKWIAGTDFGDNDIKTTSQLQADTLTISSFVGRSGVVKADSAGLLDVKLIVDADVDNNAQIQGTKISPNFGSKDVKTNFNFISTGTSTDGYLAVQSIDFKYTDSPRLTSGAYSPSGTIPTGSPVPPSTDGSIFIDSSAPDFWVKKSGTWSKLFSAPGGPAGGDLGGSYPSPNVVKLRGVPILPPSDSSYSIADGYVAQVKTISGTNKIVYAPLDLSNANSVSGTLPAANQQPQIMLGDVVGTTDSNKVVKIQNQEIDSAIPTNGYYLVFDKPPGSSGKWMSKSATFTSSPTGPASGDLSGNYPGPTVSQINTTKVPAASTAAASGLSLQVIPPAGSGSDPTDYKQISLVNVPALPGVPAINYTAGILPLSKLDPQKMGGDVDGYTSHTDPSKQSKVIRLRGRSVYVPPTLGSAQDGYFLFYKGSAAPYQWELRPPAVGSLPSGPAGGDLGDTYPGPKVLKIRGSSIPASPSANTFIQVSALNSLKYDKINLANLNSFVGSLPASKIATQTLGGDLSGTVTTSVVSKIRGASILSTPTLPNRFLSLKTSNQIEYAVPSLSLADGYINLTGRSPAPAATLPSGKTGIYFDSSDKKFKVYEGGSWKNMVIDAAKKIEKIVISDGAAVTAPSSLINLDKTRYNSSAYKMSNGQVFVFGTAKNITNGASAHIVLYDPSTNSFVRPSTISGDTWYPLDYQRTCISSIIGTKIIVLSQTVGTGATPAALNYYEYDVAAQSYSPNTTPSTITYHVSTNTASLFGISLFSVEMDNKNLFIGSYSKLSTATSICKKALIYNVASAVWSTTNNMANEREFYEATPLGVVNGQGKVLISGGRSGAATPAAVPQSELYDPSSNSFTLSSSMKTARYNHTATKMNDFSVLIAGGRTNDTTVTNKCEIYDIASSSFSNTADMSSPRIYHTATALANGNVLITGGLSNTGSILNSCEIFNARTNAFISGPNMTFPRTGHTATLLDSGKVLIFGGMTSNPIGGPVYTNDAEIYDPATNSFSQVSSSNVMYKLSASKNMSTYTSTTTPDYLIADDQTTAPTVPAGSLKTFNIDVNLPSLANVSNGQMLTICASSAAANNNYTIKLSKATSTPDVVLYNGNYNKPSVTLVAEKGTTNRWIAIDNAG